MSELVDAVHAEAKDLMELAVEHLKDEFAAVRTGRAAPALVEKLRIDYYGSEVPLQQLAGFSVPEARTLIVQPYDKGSIGAIETAIRNSDLGVNPANDGTVLRLNFPPLTEERRKDLVRVVRHIAEEQRVTVRNLRRNARHDLAELEKEKLISADDLKRAEKELDKLTQQFVDDIDSRLSVKETELLEV